MVCIIPHSPTSNLEREVVCIKASQDQIFRQSFIPCCLFLQKLSGDCQLHQKYSCWLRWLVDYHQVRLLLSESNVLVNSAPFRSANIIHVGVVVCLNGSDDDEIYNNHLVISDKGSIRGFGRSGYLQNFILENVSR